MPTQPALAAWRILTLLMMLYGLLFSAAASSADSENLVLGELMYTQSPTEQSLQDVLQHDDSHWQSVSFDEANFGFDPDHFWFRLEVQIQDVMTNLWYLRLGYPLLDHVDVYFLNNNGTILQEFHTGDKLPFAERPLPLPDFVYPLAIDNSEPHWLYIHVQTQSSVQLPLSIQSESIFWMLIADENAFSSAFYAILLSMLLYNAVIFLIVREQSYLYYVLYLASFSVLMGSIHGWSYPFLWPDSPWIHEKSVVFTLATTVSFACLFGIRFLQLDKRLPKLSKVIGALAGLTAVMAVVSLFVPYGTAIRVVTLTSMAATVIAIAGSLMEYLRSRSREVFLFLFVSVIIIAHQGLDSGFTGWSVYLLCWFLILVGVFAISASFVNFKYEMDFENLERIEQTEGRSTLDK